MDEADINVTQEIEPDWGGVKHREIKVKRCANGYIVDYQIVRKVKNRFTAGEEVENASVRETKVFITNTDLFEFVNKYFHDEPKP